MAAVEMLDIPSVKDRCSPEEWEARVNLAALYRLVAYHGWDDLIFTHISARVPGPDHHFLINPYGMMFEEITASSLVKIDVEGNIVEESPFFVNPAGFTIHSALHMNSENAHFIIHLHTDDGVAVSSQKHGLLPFCQTALGVYNDLAYHDYEGVALDLDERERLVADMGDKSFMMLYNHGTLTVGETAGDAWIRMFFLERACSMQIKALTAGGKDAIRLLDTDMQDRVEEQTSPAFNGGGSFLAWPGLLRFLDRRDPSYRD
ncbi:MAG: class II aldolase/adducin family protein [Alphaproteobacteria bacterium]